jgi:ribonuclease R
MISRIILRSMQQARYLSSCDGHFGVAAKYYCHFTSPIRRYPDLQIHRIIHDCIRGRMTEERKRHYKDILDEAADQSSMTERRAAEVERETVKLKKAQYMLMHVGEPFEGIISSVTSWGMYVELPNTVEGLVRVSDMEDDYYIFDDVRQAMVGRLSGKVYRLGDTVRVIMVGADLNLRTIEFGMDPGPDNYLSYEE